MDCEGLSLDEFSQGYKLFMAAGTLNEPGTKLDPRVIPVDMVKVQQYQGIKSF